MKNNKSKKRELRKELSKLIEEQRREMYNFYGYIYPYDPNSQDIYQKRRRVRGSGFKKK